MSEPGRGSGWEQLARKVAEVVPSEEVDALWVFPVRRQDQKEFGTAVLTRLAGDEGDRRRIYTARFMLQVKGKERGRFEADVDTMRAVVAFSGSVFGRLHVERVIGAGLRA